MKLASGAPTKLYSIDGSLALLGRPIEVSSFVSAVQRVFVSKRPGMESMTLQRLNEETDNVESNLWNTLTNMWSNKVKDDDRIHVFSLATGHMYERLLRIMMLSVTKRTSKPVKFWLFENYLSPTFKKIADAMADEYGFEIGYVTYKWPEW